MTRKVLLNVLRAIAVPFIPWLVIALSANAYIGGFLLRYPRIYHLLMRRQNARVDRQRRAAAERAQRQRAART